MNSLYIKSDKSQDCRFVEKKHLLIDKLQNIQLVNGLHIESNKTQDIRFAEKLRVVSDKSQDS